MYRLGALLQLCVMAVLLAAPAIPRDETSLVPPCCRMNGKHRCMMLQTQDLESPVIVAKCPFRSRNGVTALNNRSVILAPVTASRHEPFRAHFIRKCQVRSLFQIASVRSRPTRAPPGFSLANFL
jgi:hypothetical protein